MTQQQKVMAGRVDDAAVRTLGQRLDRAINALIVVSGVQAAKLGRESRNAENEDPRPAGAEDPLLVIERELAAMRRLLERVEDVVAGEKGTLRPTAVGQLSATELDLVVWKQWEGVPSEIVAQAAPELGQAARTIERRREREARRRRVKVRARTGEVLRSLTVEEIKQLDELEAKGRKDLPPNAQLDPVDYSGPWGTAAPAEDDDDLVVTGMGPAR